MSSSDPSVQLTIYCLLGGGMIIINFILLYQNRMSVLIDTLQAHAALLGLAMVWHAYIASHLSYYLIAGITIAIKAVGLPRALRWIRGKRNIDSAVERLVDTGLTMVIGIGLVGVVVIVMAPIIAKSSQLDTIAIITIAMAVMFLGMLMMTRKEPLTMVIGFFAIENGFGLAVIGIYLQEIGELYTMILLGEACIVIGIFFAWEKLPIFVSREMGAPDPMKLNYKGGMRP